MLHPCTHSWSGYLVLALAAANGGELIEPRELNWPLLVSLAVAIGAWLLSGIVTNERGKRALLTLGAVLVFGTYGRVTAFLQNRPLVADFGMHIVTLPLTLILAVAFTVLILRSQHQFSATGRYLNAVASILLLWSAAQFLWNVRASRNAPLMSGFEARGLALPHASGGAPHFSDRPGQVYRSAKPGNELCL